jgi:hypothetical protein
VWFLDEGITHEELACGVAFRKRTELGELIPSLRGASGNTSG